MLTGVKSCKKLLDALVVAAILEVAIRVVQEGATAGIAAQLAQCLQAQQWRAHILQVATAQLRRAVSEFLDG